jgi:hypothetical protein
MEIVEPEPVSKIDYKQVAKQNKDILRGTKYDARGMGPGYTSFEGLKIWSKIANIKVYTFQGD